MTQCFRCMLNWFHPCKPPLDYITAMILKPSACAACFWYNSDFISTSRMKLDPSCSGHEPFHGLSHLAGWTSPVSEHTSGHGRRFLENSGVGDDLTKGTTEIIRGRVPAKTKSTTSTNTVALSAGGKCNRR